MKRAIRWLFYLPKEVLQKGTKLRLKIEQISHSSIAYAEYFSSFRKITKTYPTATHPSFWDLHEIQSIGVEWEGLIGVGNVLTL